MKRTLFVHIIFNLPSEVVFDRFYGFKTMEGSTLTYRCIVYSVSAVGTERSHWLKRSPTDQSHHTKSHAADRLTSIRPRLQIVHAKQPLSIVSIRNSSNSLWTAYNESGVFNHCPDEGRSAGATSNRYIRWLRRESGRPITPWEMFRSFVILPRISILFHCCYL